MDINMKENKIEKYPIHKKNKTKRWIDSSETRDILSNSVSNCFINIPQEKSKFKLRRMHTIDSADLVYGPKLYELPKIDKINMSSSENKQSSSMESNDDNIPSFGTQFHEKGTCNPCRYEWTRGCHMGKFCRFCHHSSHVPIGTARVVPDPKTLATTKVRPENILTNQKIASYTETLNSLVESKSPTNSHSDRTQTNNNFKLIEHITKFDYNNITTYQDEGSQNNYSISKKLQNLSKLSNNSPKKQYN